MAKTGVDYRYALTALGRGRVRTTATLGGGHDETSFNADDLTDKNFQRRVGLIERVNQQTATLDCEGQKWRVGFELLQHLVDV